MNKIRKEENMLNDWVSETKTVSTTLLKHVWIVTGNSESGDQYVPYVFSKKPSKKILKQLAFELDGDIDDPTGCGDFGSYVYLDVEKVEIDKFLSDKDK